MVRTQPLGLSAHQPRLSQPSPRLRATAAHKRARVRLHDMSVRELVEVKNSAERLEILKALQAELENVLSNVERVPSAEKTQRSSKTRRRTG